MFHFIHFLFGLSPSVLGRFALRCQLQRFFDTHFPYQKKSFQLQLVCVPLYVCLVQDAVANFRLCGVELSDGGES